MTLVDTSVLVRCLDAKALQHSGAVEFVTDPANLADGLVLVPQVIVEFLSVATRPLTSNGLGLSPNEAFASIDHLTLPFLFRGDHPLQFEVWRSLIERFQVRGKAVHDARLVASMRAHSIHRIATFNAADFRRYPDLEIVVPGATIE